MKKKKTFLKTAKKTFYLEHLIVRWGVTARWVVLVKLLKIHEMDKVFLGKTHVKDMGEIGNVL